MKNKNGIGIIKSITVWVLIGVGVMGLVALSAGAIAVKTENPLQTAKLCALAAVSMGFAVSSFGSAKAENSMVAGLLCGGGLLAVTVLASLCTGGGGMTSLWLYVAAAVATAGGAIFAKGKKPSTAKRVKKLRKNAGLLKG